MPIQIENISSTSSQRGKTNAIEIPAKSLYIQNEREIINSSEIIVLPVEQYISIYKKFALPVTKPLTFSIKPAK